MARVKQTASANVAFLETASATQRDGSTPEQIQTQQAHSNDVGFISNPPSARQSLMRRLFTRAKGTHMSVIKQDASHDIFQLSAQPPQPQSPPANVQFLSSLLSQGTSLSDTMASTTMAFEIHRGYLPSVHQEDRHNLGTKDSAAAYRDANVSRTQVTCSLESNISDTTIWQLSPQPIFGDIYANTSFSIKALQEPYGQQFGYSNVTWLSGVHRGWEQQETGANADFLSNDVTTLPGPVTLPYFFDFNSTTESRSGRESLYRESAANTTLLQNSVVTSAVQPVNGSTVGGTSIGMLAYPPLNESSAGSLRLLRIDGVADSNPSNDVYCTLIAAQPWKTGVHYECLSYCWGSSTTTGRLYVRTSEQSPWNYTQITVSTNLYSAMQRLKRTHTMKWLWIDAICIDQSNLEERASQVAMMKEIYSNASGVVIWLGDGNIALTASVSTIATISKQFQTDTGRIVASIVGPDGLHLDRADIEQLRSYALPKSLNTTPRRAYKLLSYFFALPWFRRVWVLQEAFAHNEITVRLGEHTLPWGSVILAALWASGFTRTYTAMPALEHRAEGPIDRGHLPELWLGLLHTRKVRGLSILELVARARDFQASDSRDKIFALLGLANDLGDAKTRAAGLCPDYTKSTSEVYAAFAHDLVLTTGNLDILSLVSTFDSRPQRGLVSWMPHLDEPIATIRGLGFPKKYNASFGKKANMDTSPEQHIAPTVLDLTGFHIDKVNIISDKVMIFERELKVFINGTTEAITELWKTYVRLSHPHAPEHKLLQSYIELLTATGFAMPTEFPAHPLGKIVPSREVPSLIADFAAYWSRVEVDFSTFSEPLRSHLKQLAEVGDAEQFGVLAGKACHERKFLLTSERRMGLCPRDARKGDDVAILYGGSVPYILRATEDGDWTFVGECYVDGVMFGETERMQRQEQIFHLR